MIKLEVSLVQSVWADFSVDKWKFEVTRLLDKWLKFLNKTPRYMV